MPSPFAFALAAFLAFLTLVQPSAVTLPPSTLPPSSLTVSFPASEMTLSISYPTPETTPPISLPAPETTLQPSVDATSTANTTVPEHVSFVCDTSQNKYDLWFEAAGDKFVRSEMGDRGWKLKKALNRCSLSGVHRWTFAQGLTADIEGYEWRVTGKFRRGTGKHKQACIRRKFAEFDLPAMCDRAEHVGIEKQRELEMKRQKEEEKKEAQRAMDERSKANYPGGKDQGGKDEGCKNTCCKDTCCRDEACKDEEGK
ncbi:MAG: hypothetical protein M1821_009364 [Bathelium mastoideum]|nr:MAG: hypothetical protein M1821_009364 [Bathelium mastoideum]KAI9686983.1 MAG: hypothetical protein M1822_002736 [Bathelium mastoideum]